MDPSAASTAAAPGRPPVLPLGSPLSTTAVGLPGVQGRFHMTPMGTATSANSKRVGPLTSMPEASPSLRQPSIVWPPTPSPVASSQLVSGWSAAYAAGGAAAMGAAAMGAPQVAGEMTFAPFCPAPGQVGQPVYQPQVFWQAPMMMMSSQVPMQHGTAMQAAMMPMENGMHMQQATMVPVAAQGVAMAANGVPVQAAPCAMGQCQVAAADGQFNSVVQGATDAHGSAVLGVLVESGGSMDAAPAAVLVQGIAASEACGAGAAGPGPVERVQDTDQIAAAGKQLFGEALDGPQLESVQNHAEGSESSMCGLTTGPVQSAGSELHGTGNCNPCAWFWKPRGCGSGNRCPFCHMCPDGELKRRKKAKIAAIKMGILEPTHPRPDGRGAGKA